jgi:hypothetical protein
MIELQKLINILRMISMTNEPTVNDLVRLIGNVSLAGNVLVIDANQEVQMLAAAELECLGLTHKINDNGMQLQFQRTNLLALLLALGATSVDFLISGILTKKSALVHRWNRMAGKPFDLNEYPTEKFVWVALEQVVCDFERHNTSDTEALEEFKDKILPSLGVVASMIHIMNLRSIQWLSEESLNSVLGIQYRSRAV